MRDPEVVDAVTKKPGSGKHLRELLDSNEFINRMKSYYNEFTDKVPTNESDRAVQRQWINNFRDPDFCNEEKGFKYLKLFREMVDKYSKLELMGQEKDRREYQARVDRGDLESAVRVKFHCCCFC